MDYRIAVCDDQQEARDLAQDCAAQWARQRGYSVEIQPLPLRRRLPLSVRGRQGLGHPAPGRGDARVQRRGAGEKSAGGEQAAADRLSHTGYADYIAEGYDVSALHYLLKPIDRQKLFSVLDRAARALERDGKTLLLELPDGLVRLPLYEVEYLEVRGNYVTRARGRPRLHREEGPLRPGAGAGRPVLPGWGAPLW